MTGAPTRIRLVTGATLPDGDDETRLLATSLRGRGLSVDVAVWSDPAVAWGDTDLTVIRSTWDYPEHLQAFLGWVDATAAVTDLHNPPALVAENIDKRYLIALARAGVPVVPTRWMARPTGTSLVELADTEGWTDLVIKPAVGVDGNGVLRWRRGDLTGSGSPGSEHPFLPPRPQGWILQPFVRSVIDPGERSVVMIDGRPAWAVTKRPTPDGGDIRVQERWGGSTRLASPDASADAVAERALAALTLETPPLYARVDLLVWEGSWHVTEVELVEPSLYFMGDTTRAQEFATALASRLGR